MRPSNLTEREISGIKIINQGRHSSRRSKKAITQMIVAKRRGEVRDDLSVKQETERETALVDTRRPRISTLVVRVGWHFDMRQSQEDSTQKVKAVSGAQVNPLMS